MRAPGTMAWFARHELRLAWRDWVAMMTAGGRTRVRTLVLAVLVGLVAQEGLEGAMGCIFCWLRRHTVSVLLTLNAAHFDSFPERCRSTIGRLRCVRLH